MQCRSFLLTIPILFLPSGYKNRKHRPSCKKFLHRTVFFVKKSKLKPLEISLLVMLALCLLVGDGALSHQDALQRKLIRLHVIANSDSPRDQQIKLQVRDSVLDFATELLRQAPDRQAANRQLEASLPEIEQAANRQLARCGSTDTAAVSLRLVQFPLKTYDGFALPSGEYLALRVVIGAGEGRNWWCVVYPPLCTTAAADLEETAISCGMEEQEIRLMEGETPDYQLKFRTVELWQRLRQLLGK